MTAFFIAIIGVFFSAFYFQPNLGGEGLFLPFNSVVWITVAIVVILAVWRMWQQQMIRLPAFWGWILAMPLLILLTGFIVGMEQPLSWMLRISAIFLGFLFFFSLFQFNVRRHTLQNALYILCGAFTLHGLVGVIQLLPGSLISGIIPNMASQIPIGMFQQPNLQASLMATAVGLSVYLLSTPDFRSRPVLAKSLLLLCLLLSSFVLLSAGSRVGLLGGGAALLLMVSCRLNLLKRNARWSLAMLVVLLVGGVGGLIINDGALRAYSKMETLAEEGQDIRQHVYRISWQAIKDKPLLGHGIGSFQTAFHEKAAEYQLENENFKLTTQFSHPHNELLLWGVESGIVGLLAFLCAVVTVLLQLFKLGWQRGGAMAALLLPIALHTQVELPFYISAYHWVVFLFLLFITFQSGHKTYPLHMSIAAGWMIRSVSVLLLAIVVVFCGSSLYYSQRIAYVVYSGEDRFTELSSISKHPYFTDIAMRLLLANLSKAERVTHDTAITLEYVKWMETYLKSNPDVGVFVDLIRVYDYLGDSVQMQRVIKRALYFYNDQPLILQAVEDLQKNASNQADASALIAP
ncbi:PglL family O-oligosaccharyltransferase [Neptunomonas antarctica]|uniref:PglL family O-oligosaccharyltransferase n=1 Tax=Neptunomonas antarctica TaxID=619304 RepID=UPI00138F7B25|nr:Wzy polymerase domain-containing protein [Neptunomonas antarctica]